VFGKRTQDVAKLIMAADVEQFVPRYRAGTMTVEVDGETLPLAGDMVVIAETPRSGWAVASAGAETVALDLELTHELRLAGLFREVVRMVQDARKSAGLEVTDRIALHWRVGGSPEPAEAIRAHAGSLAAEVLASSVDEGAPQQADGWHVAEDDDLGLRVWLRRA
jgi:isoleucyl-tRNA synthetase